MLELQTLADLGQVLEDAARQPGPREDWQGPLARLSSQLAELAQALARVLAREDAPPAEATGDLGPDSPGLRPLWAALGGQLERHSTQAGRSFEALWEQPLRAEVRAGLLPLRTALQALEFPAAFQAWQSNPSFGPQVNHE